MKGHKTILKILVCSIVLTLVTSSFVAVGGKSNPPIAYDDYEHVFENSNNNTIDVLDNDYSPKWDISIISVSKPKNGKASFNDDYVYYTPKHNFVGSDDFVYTIEDEKGRKSSATVYVTVKEFNNTPPVAVDDYYIVMENSMNNIVDVLANDYDIDGDQLTIISITQPYHGMVTFDGYFIYYTPDMDYYGPDEFTYTITDGKGGTDSATVYIEVIPDVHVPVANDDYFTVMEDSIDNVFDVLINDCDPYGEDLDIISVTTPLHGSVYYTPDFIYYTPDQNYNGVDIFSYTIINEAGYTSTAEVYITVTAVNDPPVAVDDVYTVMEDSINNVLYVLSNDMDIDGDSLTIISVTQPAHGMLTFMSNYLLYTPNPDYCGPDQFSYTISDGNGGSDSATVYITVTCVNDPPIAVDDYAVVAENSTNNMIDVLANDYDVDGDNLDIIEVTAPSHGTVTCWPYAVYYTPNVGYVGPDQFSYSITDNNGGFDTATVYILVGGTNTPPVANHDVISVNEDSVDNMIDVLANDYDPDNDTIFIISITDPSHGFVSTDGICAYYTPDANYCGADLFDYSITDGNGGTDTASVFVNVLGVNDAPNAVDDFVQVFRNTTDVKIYVLLNDDDIDGDEIDICDVTQPIHGTVTYTADNVYYTPPAGFLGDDSFEYTITDHNGGFDSAIVYITVVELINNTPPVAVDDAATVPEDSNDNQIDVLFNDYDVDGDDLDIIGVTDPNHGTTTFTINFVYYTPDPDYSGSDSFYYTISDGAGGTDSAQVFIMVSAINDPPIANDDAAVVIKNTVDNLINVLINDFDPDGDALTIVSVSSPMYGFATTDGDFVYYTPDLDFIGMDQFDYAIFDGNGGSDVATVTVTVEDQPLNPIANDDFMSVLEDSIDNQLDVLANDYDPDGDPLTIVSITDPYHGTACYDGTYIYYTPNANYFGLDQLMYTISDGQGGTDVATVYITVGAINDPPIAVDDTAVVAKDSSNNMINVLVNDLDIDGDALSITGVTIPSHGTVTYTTNFVYYTPDPDYFGNDQFSYAITDGNGATDAATVYITVN